MGEQAKQIKRNLILGILAHVGAGRGEPRRESEIPGLDRGFFSAFVTGGSRGIGYATVEAFLKEGAHAFVFLASDEASYITGVVLRVDGMARA